MNCKFFQWFDLEPPNGWKYLALVEARNIIRKQKEEIANLRDQERKQIHKTTNLEEILNEVVENLDEKNEECVALKRQVLVLIGWICCCFGRDYWFLC